MTPLVEKERPIHPKNPTMDGSVELDPRLDDDERATPNEDTCHF